jgi:uroporphyrinogen decarboxylase
MIDASNSTADEMTPKERMDALATGKPIDRIPCFPQITDHACRLIGVPISRCFHSAELMAEAVIGVFRTYRPDGVMVTPTLHGIAEAMGTKLTFPEDVSPFVSEPLLKE